MLKEMANSEKNQSITIENEYNQIVSIEICADISKDSSPKLEGSRSSRSVGCDPKETADLDQNIDLSINR
jgi:ribosome maturation factor RimP